MARRKENSMEGIMVTLYDSKAETYTAPHCVESPAAGIRQFDTLVNDRQPTLVSTHPEDFTLFQIATYKDAAIQPCPKLCLANGVDVKRSAPLKSVAAGVSAEAPLDHLGC